MVKPGISSDVQSIQQAQLGTLRQPASVLVKTVRGRGSAVAQLPASCKEGVCWVWFTF